MLWYRKKTNNNIKKASRKDDVKKADIEIVSITNGEESRWRTTGEYKLDGELHLIVYTDYTGNTITKNGLYVGGKSMLLHRTGGITGDMLFDLQWYFQSHIAV